MRFFLLLALFTLVQVTVAQDPDIAAFKDAYHHRRTDVSAAKVDPAVSKALDVIVSRIERGARLDPKRAETKDWAGAFKSSIPKPTNDFVAADEYRSIVAGYYRTGPFQVIVAIMGAVSKTRVYDRSWHRIALPKAFDWYYPWQPEPRYLPSGILLLDSNQIEVAGNREDHRLDFMRLKGGALHTIYRFQGVSVLECDRAEVHENRVTVRVVPPTRGDESQADRSRERAVTFDCSGGQVKRVRG